MTEHEHTPPVARVSVSWLAHDRPLLCIREHQIPLTYTEERIVIDKLDAAMRNEVRP